MEKSVTAHAKMTVQLEFFSQQPWNQNCELAQVYRQAESEVRGLLAQLQTRAFDGFKSPSRARFTVKNIEIDCILIPKDAKPVINRSEYLDDKDSYIDVRFFLKEENNTGTAYTILSESVAQWNWVTGMKILNDKTTATP